VSGVSVVEPQNSSKGEGIFQSEFTLKKTTLNVYKC